ncbi:hypothetical protein FF38_00301 [Lucilia cuprina]|uniref:Uncharacterized protein n=1 Tax=Lucilia cuprina TaxID=7375 RepID=A0A0L0BLH8_LUCCU|nr:hypothetical protein FF38_00301 [Lucilia cuprina]
MLPILLLSLVLFCVKNASCDYENTWNFYYEQPCCGNEVTNYIKHKRGINFKFINICMVKSFNNYFFNIIYEYERNNNWKE